MKPESKNDNQPIKLYLAPMEGVTDWIMRDLLTKIGGIDFCVTEFLRVTKTLHPNKIFFRHCPELLNNSKTTSGTPVYFQLLGGEPNPLAENAQRVAELGAAGIDLNFGCPAKTVNRHDGGAVLLKSPNRLFDITKSVRTSVPEQIPVSGKIRLGFDDTSLLIENALALQEAGASWITVHCRTKMQGYRPPAHWHYIAILKESISIPIIANGDIDSLESFNDCLNITGTQSFMIGRASLADPFLFKKIKQYLSEDFNQCNLPCNTNSSIDIVNKLPETEWENIERLIAGFYLSCERHINGYFATSRTKQWLKYLLSKNSQSAELFHKIKIYKNPSEFHIQMINNFKSNALL